MFWWCNMAKGKLPASLQRAVRVTAITYAVAVILSLMIVLLFIPWWIQWCLLFLLGIAFRTSLIAPFLDDWRPKPRVPAQGKAVLISGCSSGFGNILAQRLDALGLQVFAGYRYPEKESVLKKVLKRLSSDRLHIVQLDVTSDESVRNAVKYVADNIGNNKLWAVVNNAGVNAMAEIAWTSVEAAKEIFEVNTFGVMRLTKAFIPLLCKNKGRVVIVSSAAGRYTLPGGTIYCMTKHAATSFAEGLRLEMYRFGVKVITIEPWMYRTPMTEEENVLSYMTKTLEEVPTEVKELYPENYLERIRSIFIKISTFSKSENVYDVVNCMEEAILALDPKYTYNPGTLYYKLSFWFLRRLPKAIADGFLLNEIEFPIGHED